MKKFFITSFMCFFLGAAAMAQEPGKAATKKKVTPITIVPVITAVTENSTETKKREAEKKKHFEALKAGKVESTENSVPQSDAKGTKKKKAN